MISRFSRYSFLLLLLISPAVVRADTAAFDLPGPKVEVRVMRGGSELPVSQVPSLREGDRLWVHPDFPESQSAHYLLIVAFLRGTTNPPPENWFTRIETWNKRVRDEGRVITVPKGAEQGLLFLAPETGGDFDTLRTAVRGKPGAFVRALQDLNEATLDRSRLETYLLAVKAASDSDPEKLKEMTTLLARSLGIRLDSDCFKKPVEQQESCLTRNTDQLVLDDAHTQSMVAELTSGTSADLISQMSSTPFAGGGFYSAYVGAVVDLVRLTSSFHTAEYQYIPALAVPHADELNLKLNTAPSFRNPKSVLVIALPAVEAPKLPTLKPVDAKGVYCLSQPSMVLPVSGAPLVFSTQLAHNFVLHVANRSGQSLDLSAKPDPTRGGFVIETENQATEATRSAAAMSAGVPDATHLGGQLTGTLRGQWGFDTFDGPTFSLRTAHPANWIIASADQMALVVGREDTLHVESEAAPCEQNVTLNGAGDKDVKTTWKVSGSTELQVQVALTDAVPGPLTMRIQQYGLASPDNVALHTFSQPAKLTKLVIDAGDQQALLVGTRLDEVAAMEVGGVQFTPGPLKRSGEDDELLLQVSGAKPAAFSEGESETAKVTLKDRRVLQATGTVQPPRPKVTLLSKVIQPDPAATPSPIQLHGDNELPQNAKLWFSLKADAPATFPREQKIEVATQDESVRTMLSIADGTLSLQDSHTVVAVLDPQKSLGPSAFGPLRFRPVDANGESGDWQPLVNLVRLPEIKSIQCSHGSEDLCTLTGTQLYLLDSVSSDQGFQQVTPVPDGFAGSTLSVPHPVAGQLYVKLRDDPAIINRLVLPVTSAQARE